jgi:hypothetical protein
MESHNIRTALCGLKELVARRGVVETLVSGARSLRLTRPDAI